MEVQAHAALGVTHTFNFILFWCILSILYTNHSFLTGFHENIVSYYTSWFENEKLYIQMELCDRSLSVSRSSKLFTEREVLEAMHQVSIV